MSFCTRSRKSRLKCAHFAGAWGMWVPSADLTEPDLILSHHPTSLGQLVMLGGAREGVAHMPPAKTKAAASCCMITRERGGSFSTVTSQDTGPLRVEGSRSPRYETQSCSPAFLTPYLPPGNRVQDRSCTYDAVGNVPRASWMPRSPRQPRWLITPTMTSIASHRPPQPPTSPPERRTPGRTMGIMGNNGDSHN